MRRIILLFFFVILSGLVLILSKAFFDKGNIAEVPQSKIHAGVVPHHLPVSSMIDHFFSKLSSQTVDTIFVLAPNHDESGECKVLTTDEIPTNFQDYDLKNLSIDERVLDSVLDLEFVCISKNLVSQEHGISTLLPYISDYFLEKKVIVFAISNFLSMKEIDSLVEVLNDNKKNNSVFVASVDFSHYLSYEEANQKDRETIFLIKNRDYEKLIQLDYEHLDSPESVIVLQKIMDKNNIYKFSIIAYENLANITHDTTQPSTSYFEIIW